MLRGIDEPYHFKKPIHHVEQFRYSHLKIQGIYYQRLCGKTEMYMHAYLAPTCTHMCIHTCTLHTCIHANHMHAYTPAMRMHTCAHTCILHICTQMYTHIHTTHMHTYPPHTYIHNTHMHIPYAHIYIYITTHRDNIQSFISS